MRVAASGEKPAPEAPTLKRAIGPWLLTLFVIGDLLGTGIYALTGEVAGMVGGVVWLPFLLAVVVALVTALSYLELVTKYPHAAGAALYVHKAFGRPFLTFMIGFAVVASGVTSASTASRAFAANLSVAFGLGLGDGITVAALAYIIVIAAINYRGVGESLTANVILTCVELAGLLIIIAIGAMVVGQGQGDLSRVTEFRTASDASIVQPMIAATALAFFAMVGFEDAVNMVEETKEPSRTFPRAMLLGIAITAVVYVMVSVAAIAVVPPEQLAVGDTPLLTVVDVGAPAFPVWIFGVITMFAVANTGLLNMLMASRLVYGMSREGVLPTALGRIQPARRTPHVAIGFTTLLAVVLIAIVGEIPALAGTTSLLLLTVFVVVNLAVVVLRRDLVEHPHFRSPGMLPVLGALLCAFLVGPWTGREPAQYAIATVLIGIGIALWLVKAWPKRAIAEGRR